MSVQLNVRLSEEDQTTLEQLKEQAGLSTSAIIKAALHNYALALAWKLDNAPIAPEYKKWVASQDPSVRITAKPEGWKPVPKGRKL